MFTVIQILLHFVLSLPSLQNWFGLRLQKFNEDRRSELAYTSDVVEWENPSLSPLFFL